MDLLLQTAKKDRVMQEKSYGRKDGKGGVSKMVVWNHPPDNLFGMFCRCRRIVEGTERLLKDEVYHYHSKVMLKEGTVT
jgi:ectoine hydroxylase